MVPSLLHKSCYWSIIFTLIINTTAYGQLMPTIISSSGSSAMSGDENFHLSWTLGEFVVTTVRDNDNIYKSTQGFHQPEVPCSYVLTTEDVGFGSLRNAIDCANRNPGPDTVYFSIAGSPPYVINLQTPLPSINDANTILLANTQPEFVPGEIIIDGALVNSTPGLTVNADNCIIEGLNFKNFNNSSGVVFSGVEKGLVKNNVFENNGVGVGVIALSSSITISENSFSCNRAVGIFLSPGTNGNTVRNKPYIEKTNSTAIWGASEPGDSIEVYVFDPDNCSNYICQGKVFLGKTLADSQGRWALEGNFEVYVDKLATVTGTDKFGNTTEFSDCFKICPLVLHMLRDSICKEGEYFFGDKLYSASGVYYDTISLSGNICDSIVQLDLTVINPDDLPNALAHDIVVCTNSGPLIASEIPYYISGKWSTALPGLQIEDPIALNTKVNGLNSGENEITWTLYNKFCLDYDSIHVSVFFDDAQPEAFPDEFILNIAEKTHWVNLLENDDFDRTSSKYRWKTTLSNVTPHSLNIIEDRYVGLYKIELDRNEQVVNFLYYLTNDNCPENFDTASVNIFFKTDEEFDKSRAFSPNGDGVNDYFFIPELVQFPDKYKKNELVVFSRWGDLVFEASPYNNDWDGTNIKTGKALPAGTYYFILWLDLGDGEIKQGQLTIVR